MEDTIMSDKQEFEQADEIFVAEDQLDEPDKESK